MFVEFMEFTSPMIFLIILKELAWLHEFPVTVLGIQQNIKYSMPGAISPKANNDKHDSQMLKNEVASSTILSNSKCLLPVSSILGSAEQVGENIFTNNPTMIPLN